jgi:hypothetical protein
MVTWKCPRCTTRISGAGRQAEAAAIAWMALWHVEREHVDGAPTDPEEAGE